jgi:ABC-type multidrug transport system fused ATPase/permease subunit
MKALKKSQTYSLLGVLKFLRKYPGGVLLTIGLLLVNISIEMTLPQFLGNAITQLRDAAGMEAEIPLETYVKIFVVLVLVRGGVGMILGPIRNRVIQGTLGDIRAAIYDAIQRLSFTYHDKSNSGELISRSTTDVWRLQESGGCRTFSMPACC